MLEQMKGPANLKITTPSFSIDATWSAYLDNNFMLCGMLLIYGVGLFPKPLPYFRLNHAKRGLVWCQPGRKHKGPPYGADSNIVIYLAMWITVCLSVWGAEEGSGKGDKNLGINLKIYLKLEMAIGLIG